MPYRNSKILLVGTGAMAKEYLKVLHHIGVQFKVVGRGESSARQFTHETGVAVAIGLPALLEKSETYTHAIVATDIDQLATVTRQIMEKGISSILVEKPGAASPEELQQLNAEANALSCSVYLAYNRRFYASTLKAREIIFADGGVLSFNFEFTEWAHEVEKLVKRDAPFMQWFLDNSSHVVDLAFHLGGKPEQLFSFTAGKLEWHPSAAIFAGAGKSVDGALFNYQANWLSPGRWGVEMLTAKHRLILRPMERLQIQKIASVAITEHEDINYDLDKLFKPGLLLQVIAFLDSDYRHLCTLQEQSDALTSYYMKMANYRTR